MADMVDILYKTEKEIEYSRRHENWELHWYLLKELVRIHKIIEKLDRYRQEYGRNQRKLYIAG